MDNNGTICIKNVNFSIHSFVIEQGKNLLMNGHNVNETAHMLGFEFPHHFTRRFKKVTGITPTDFLGK